MSRFKTLFINKNAIKTLLGFSLGVGLSFGAYQINRQTQVSIQQMHASNSSQFLQTISSQQLLSKSVEPSQIPQASESEIKEVDTHVKILNMKKGSSENIKNEQRNKKTEKKVYVHMNQIQIFPPQLPRGQQTRTLIVADIPYNQNFQAKVMVQVNKIAEKFNDVKIYRKDFSNKQETSAFQREFKVKIKNQTIFVLQNSYDRGMNNIDFDIFMQYPSLIEIYLKDVQANDEKNVKDIASRLSRLNPHQSCLLYLYDKNEPQQKIKQRLLAAKYIEMEMAINNLYGVKLQVVDKNAAVAQHLIDPENSRTNSVHLFRKHNIYTPFDPNFYLTTQNNRSLPFHRLADIALFAKEGHNLLITQYLSQLETFDAMASAAPYMCTLRVDRNRITDDEYMKLLQIFGELKRKNIFPNISFSLKLKKIPFAGKESLPNKQWQITLSNLDQLDKETMIHQIKNVEQLKFLGIKEKEFLRTSHDYIYEHNVVSQELIKQFLEKGSKNQLPKYHKSEEPYPLASLHKLVGTSFNSEVLEDQKDHFVYQYSQFCPTCKKISPVIQLFTKIVKDKNLGLDNVSFHKFDANKNRVKGQLSSPYIPNIFYYKNQWKKNGPVRFPIEMLSQQGIISLYQFCAITKELGSVQWKDIDRSIQSVKAFKRQQFQFL